MPPVNDPLFENLPNDLRDSITKPIGEWESTSRPLLPTGYYFGECVEVLRGNSSQKGTVCFTFICTPREWADGAGISQPLKPADKDLLDSTDLSTFEFPRRDQVGYVVPAGTIWLHPNAMGMNREFFTNMGFPESRPMDECILAMKGLKVLMGIGRDDYERNGVKREFNVMTSLAQDPR